MRYYKNIEADYIMGIGTGSGGEEITQEEYESILSTIRNRPFAEPGYDHRLKADLSWELVEVAPEPVDDEISAEEALNIILGGEA
jgi:hypothetical protein